METLTSISQAATKAIWGTPSSQEPVSGKTGDVSKGEPYDAGNMDPPEAEHVEHAPSETNNKGPKTPSSTLPTSEEVQNSMLYPDKPADQSTSTATTAKDDDKPDINPTKLKDSSVTSGDATAAQNDVRDPSDPATDPDKLKGRDNVDDTDGLDKGDNPEKLDGPGPRPVAEIAKENGGDAGRGSREGLPSPSASGDLGADKHVKKPDEEDHKDDRGLLYVRSSGLNAEGGDFDASKPGAGREADRLLEEKGVKRNDHGGIEGDLHEGGSNGSHKKSLKEKIKAKLHKVGPV